MSHVVPVFWLTVSLLRRMLREGVILRSLAFPGGITVGTYLLAIGVMSTLAPPDQTLGVQGEPTAEVRRMAEEVDVVVVSVEDAEQAVRDGDAAVAMEPATGRLVVDLRTVQALSAESVARQTLGSGWRPLPVERGNASDDPPDPSMNTVLMQLLGVLFALYGVVFGAGGIARDRASGLLDASTSLPVPHVAVGLSRWLAGSLALGGASAMTGALVAGAAYLQDPLHVTWQVMVATSATTAVGILVVGRARLDRGFAGPLSLGLSITMVLMALTRSPLAPWLPVASIFRGPDQATWWSPLPVTLALGLLASMAFARRTAVT